MPVQSIRLEFRERVVSETILKETHEHVLIAALAWLAELGTVTPY
jgi:hypothetical protein